MQNQWIAAGQQLRPESERYMLEYERDALDRARADEIRDMKSHPALWAKLCAIEAKLDRLLNQQRTSND